MKAVLLTRDYNRATGELGAVECREVEKPRITRDDEILIKVAYASICGSDPNLLKGAFDVPIPSPAGHEMSGTIVEMGKGVGRRGLQVGDAVTGNFYLTCGVCHWCTSGKDQFCENAQGLAAAQAEYVVWRESQVYKLPQGVDLLTGALAEPFNIALRAVELADFRLGAKVAVSGGGGIGLLVTSLLKNAGAASVTVLEPVEKKRALAKTMGADHALDPADPGLGRAIQDITDGVGFDAVIESSGSAVAAQNALGFVTKGGTVLYMSMYRGDYELPVNLFKYCYHNEIRIQGMFLAQTSFARAVDMLPRVDLKPIVEKMYGLEECVQAYEDQMSGQYAKLVFDCTR